MSSRRHLQSAVAPLTSHFRRGFDILPLQKASENLILDENRQGVAPQKLLKNRSSRDVCCSDGAELIGKSGSPKEAHDDVVVI
jgi:hypothetical protein